MNHVTTTSIQQKNNTGNNSVNISLYNKNERLDFDELLRNLNDSTRISNYQDYINKFRNFMYKHKSIDLREVYVPLSLELESNFNKTYTKFDKQITEKSEDKKNIFLVDNNFSFKTLLNNENNIVNIVGTAGQGKSSLLRFIASKEFNNGYIPIYIPCIKIENHSIYSCVNDILGRFFNFPNLEEKTLSAFIKFLDKNEYKLFVVFDGFDELILEKSEEKIEEIEKFSDKYLLPILLSSRPGSKCCNRPRITQYRLCDLSKKELINVIKNYTLEEEYLTNIFKSLEKNHEFSNCIKTPLLACLVADNYIHFQKTPNNPKIFYNEILSVLLRRHDSTKEKEVSRGFHKKYPNIDDDLFSEIFYILCLFILIRKKTSITIKELESFAESSIKISKCSSLNLSESETKKLAIDFVFAVIHDTCLIIKNNEYEKEENYVFCHKSIWEFYAAKIFETLTISNDLISNIIKFLIDKYNELDAFFFNHFEFVCVLNDLFALKSLLLPYLESIGISEEGKLEEFKEATDKIARYFLENSSAKIRKRGVTDIEIEQIIHENHNLSNNSRKRKDLKKSITVTEFQFILTSCKMSPIFFVNTFLRNKLMEIREIPLKEIINDFNSMLEDVLKENNGIDKISNYFDKLIPGRQNGEKSFSLLDLLNTLDLKAPFYQKVNAICVRLYHEVYINLKLSLDNIESKKENQSRNILDTIFNI
mgnify:CR=1 FL=1